MLSTRWEYSLTVPAFVMRYAVGTKLISRITIWVLVLLGWISRTVCAADVSALVTSLAAREEEGLALVAVPSHSLTGFLVDEILSSSLAGSSKNNLLFVKLIRVIGNDWGVLLVGLDDGGPPLATGDNLCFGSLGRVAGALCATGMLAVGALLGRGKGGAALVAGSSNTHADGFVHTKDSVVGGSSGELGKLDFQSISVTQLLGSFLQQLAPGQFGNTFESLIASPGLSGSVWFGFGNWFTLLDRLRLGGRCRLGLG